eukprot:2345930-Pyramimonas_sp.AAC.1
MFCKVIQSSACLSGHAVQRWAGRVVDILLIRREALSALRPTYDFTRMVGAGRQRARTTQRGSLDQGPRW